MSWCPVPGAHRTPSRSSGGKARPATHYSVAEVRTDIDNWNDNARPHMWTKLADDTGSPSVDGGEQTASETQPMTAESTAPTVSDVELPVVTPDYVCTTDNESGFLQFFGYTNDGIDPVVVESGNDNNLSGGNPDDNPLVPVVFAPGEVFPAFWTVTYFDDPLPMWSLTGPDGTTRVASPEPEVECDEEAFSRIEADPRVPVIDVSFERVDDTSVAITAQVIDLPELSVCPPGLQPERVQVRLETSSGLLQEGEFEFSTEEVSNLVQVDVELLQVDKTSRAFAAFSALITDVCSFDEVETSSWAVSSFFPSDPDGIGIAFERDYCVDAPGGPSAEPLALIVSGWPNCSPLERVDGVLAVAPGTAGGGGMRIR